MRLCGRRYELFQAEHYQRDAAENTIKLNTISETRLNSVRAEHFQRDAAEHYQAEHYQRDAAEHYQG